MSSQDVHTIEVGSTVAICSCGEFGDDESPKSWANQHKSDVTKIKVDLRFNSGCPGLTYVDIVRLDGGTTEGWSAETKHPDEDGDIIIVKFGVRCPAWVIGARLDNGQSVMTVIVDREDTSEVKIVERQ